MNLTKKKLIVLAMVLVSILIVILVYGLKDYESVLNKGEEKQMNIYEVKNNDSFVVKYGDYVYYVPENKVLYSSTISHCINKFLESEKSGDSIGEILMRVGRSKISSNLTIYANKLFYAQDDYTHKMELNDGTTETFCKGELQYIGEKRALTLSDGILYSVPYYEETFLPEKYKKIVIGDCHYLYEDDDALYYYSIDSVQKSTVFSVDKSTFEVTILLELKKHTESVKQLISTNKFVYCFIEDGESNYISRINLKNITNEKLDLSEYADVYMFKNDAKNNIYFYASKNYGEEKAYICKENSFLISEYEGDVNGEYIKKYSIEFNDDLIKLYKDKLFFAKFNVDINNLTYVEMQEITKIDDFIYYKIYYVNSEKSEKTIIVRASSDGKIVQKLK